MNKDVVRKWIKALRSGEYKQSRGWIRCEDTYCVLGVLCDLHMKEFEGSFGEWEEYDYLSNKKQMYSYQDVTRELPSLVDLWAELPSKVISYAMQANDEGVSFKKLANHIEIVIFLPFSERAFKLFHMQVA